MSESITCPWGLTGRLRGMKVREDRILADRKLPQLQRRPGDRLMSATLACRVVEIEGVGTW